MVATRIATTFTRDLQPLGTGGQLAIDAAEALFALLTRELTPTHAALFAEPHANIERGEVDWYAEGAGSAERLSRLPPEHAAPVQAELDRLSGDIRGLVARLRGAPRESDRFLAEMLDRALQVPDGDAIWVRAGRPVLVGWGHERVGPAPGPVPFLGRVRHAPPMTILPPPELPSGAGPRIWPRLAAFGVSFFLLAGAVWLVLERSAAGGPGLCRVPDGDLAAVRTWLDADAQNAALRMQLAALTDNAGHRRLQCRSIATAVPPSPADDSARAQQRGGHQGKLQIILAWNDRNDLDLHVFCPDGEHLFFQNRQACGGELDVDANANTLQTTTTPVENMFWSDPHPGTYKVVVDPYDMREGTGSAFRLTVRQDGQPDRVQDGTATAGHSVSFEVQVSAP